MSAFNHAWDLIKALSTEDLRMAARTGGIQMTPERRQAYADAGLPLSTGGGFRTMPETEARRLVTHQKTGSYEGIDGYIDDPKHPLFDPRHKEEILESLHHDLDTGGSLDMDDRLYDRHHILTQGQSMPDPMEIQEPTVVGSQKVENIDEYGLPVPNFDIERAIRSQRGPRGPRSGIPIGARTKITPGPRRTASEPTRIFSKPFTSTDPESEFSRRGDAGASPSDQAFKIIQQRKDNAERMKQVLADRQQEMAKRQQDRMMQIQRDRMKSKQPPKGRAGGRRPGEGKNAYKNRMRRQGGRR